MAYKEWSIRAFRLAESAVGRTVADLERSVASPERMFVERIRRGVELIEAAPDTVLQSNDIVAIGARRRVLLGGNLPLRQEVEDPELLAFPMAALDVVVTKRSAVEQSLTVLGQQHGRGVVLAKLIRGGEEIPFTPETIVNRGDILRLAGAQRDVERAGAALGYIERPSSESDVVFLGLGIVIGGLVGLLTLTVGGLPLTLTTSGGALIMGLVFGWLRSVYPTFGRIPEPALWIFDTVGLAVFIGVVGLTAGPTFVSGLRQTGPSLLVVGMIVALLPHLVTLLFGLHVLKMNPVILFGACAGAGTVTAALRAIQDESQSKIPVLGYTVPYAIGNILLTAWGPVIVVLTQ
jgi:putative transport protein